jgi:16S rRNA (uracil1498-N3)-methyltransferase
MAARFYVPENLEAGQLSFDGSEFHHMIRVTRHQVGDTVRLFDGTGREADAKITFISRHAATLKVGNVEKICETDHPQLILAVAMPKSSRAGWLVEKAVELGVSKIIPLKTSRTVVNPRESKLETLRGNIVSACKQCGRSRLMEIDSSMTWADFADSVMQENVTVVAHPGGAPFTESFVQGIVSEASRSGQKNSSDKNIVVAIGPEGGFSVEEVTLALTRDASLVSLGPRTLRVETAALAVATVFESAQLAENPRLPH